MSDDVKVPRALTLTLLPDNTSGINEVDLVFRRTGQGEYGKTAIYRIVETRPDHSTFWVGSEVDAISLVKGEHPLIFAAGEWMRWSRFIAEITTITEVL